MARGVGRESERELLASKSHFVRYLWPPSPTSILPVHFALPFILTSGESLAPGGRESPCTRTIFEQQLPASFRRADGNLSAAAFNAHRAHALSVRRVSRAIRGSGARAVVLYLWARVAFVAREPEAGFEAAAMDRVLSVTICNA